MVTLGEVEQQQRGLAADTGSGYSVLFIALQWDRFVILHALLNVIVISPSPVTRSDLWVLSGMTVGHDNFLSDLYSKGHVIDIVEPEV